MVLSIKEWEITLFASFNCGNVNVFMYYAWILITEGKGW
jgi:hypothetical protein